jgi:hypothetical protein
MSEPAARIGKDATARRYLVKTNVGDVIVVVNPLASGLADDLFAFEPVTPEGLEQVDMTTPLSAFGAKVVDLIELHGTAEFTGSETLRDMLVREKATSELRRIERFAQQHAGR